MHHLKITKYFLLFFFFAALLLRVSSPLYAQTTVTTVVPAKHALNIATATTIQVTLNAAMSTTSLNDTSSFIVSGATSGRHRGSFAFSNGNTIATFNPTIDFLRGEVVTVNVTSNVKDGSNNSVTPFITQFTIASNRSTGSFASRADYGTGSNPQTIFMSDIDDDGDADFATANYWGGNVTVWKNSGDGTFASRNDISTSANPWGISMNDVDNDGDGDIIVSHNSSSLVSVLNNNGNGTFAAKEDYSVPAGRGIYVSDLNGDGYVDIAVANSDNVTVLMNNGNGTFASGVNYSGGGTTISVFIKDVDNDGDGDIVTTNFTASSISVLKNNGNGTFASKVDYTTEAQPWSVFVSDVDGDGDADIAVTYIGTSAVSVLKNNGDGTFATKVNYTTGTDPKSVFISDVDGDGDGDIVVGNKTDNNVSVLKNNGNGTFAGKTDFPLAANANPESVFLTDVDGNGTPDIATANWNGPSVSILRNIEITKVAAISPEQNALNVSPSSNIQVTFNKSMNSSSITDSTLIVSGNVSGKHNGSITFINGNSVATFNPTNDFKRGEVVTVNVTTDVKDNTNTDVQTFTSQFTVEVNPSPGTFSTRTTYTTGGGPEYPYAVDIDNDGDVDVLTANYSGSSISVLKNNGSGTFGTRVDYPVGGSPYVVIAGDLDDDGDADIVSSGTNVDSVYVLKNNGNGIFASAMGYQTNGYPEGGHFMQDIDGDGDNDIVAGGGLSSFSVLLNNGDGTFAPFLSSLTASNPYYVTGGDMNGDGYLDVIAVCPSGSKVSIALNNGNGTFADRVDYQTGNNPYFVAVQDVDGDGDLDVIASLYSDGNISIYQNNGDGSLGARVDYSSGISPTAVFLSDVEGDGDADIVVSNDVSDAAQNVLNPRIRESQTKVQLKKTTGSIAILKNNGNGTFETKIDYDGGSSAWGISLTDIDGDGDGDMIVPNYYDNTISVLRNVLSPPQNVFARGGNETAVVKWDANSENGFKQYNIYTGTTPNPTSFVGNTTPGNINETSIVVSGLTNGTINYFRVTAVDSAGGESNYSEQDAAVPVVEGGDAISLNGISDYVTANVSLSSYSQFTVEAYVKINGPLNGFITIVEFGDDSPFFGINNGTPVFYPAVWATTTINQNQWYHLAWVYDGTNAYIYIDGILYGFAANPEFSKSGTEMGIGYHNGDGHFNGSIDEVRIWNVARYQSEIRASLGSPAQGDESGLVALYHFDEGTGFTAIDGSVNANDGTLIGEPSYVVSQAMIPFIPKGFGVNSQANQIYLHWYANTEGDIQSYKIYKGTQSPADSLAFTVSSAAEDFYDTDVPSLMPYYYRITAVDNVGNESDFSNEVSTTPLFYSSVSGMVWNDENSNSEKDAGELGVSGWTIRLEEQVGKRKDENKTSVTDVTTDADGNYSFTQVLPGFYKIAQINLSTWIQTFPLDSGDYFLEVVNGENYSGKSFGIVRRGIVIPPANDSIFYWNDTSVWSGGRIPTAEDSIVIPPNITIILNTDSLLAQNKSVGTLIISTGSIIQALGNDTLRIIGNLMINGTLNVDSVTNPVFNCEGNFIVNGVFRPGRSHIIIIGTTQQKVGSGGGPGKYTASTTTEFYTITNTNSLMETQGKIVVNNALVVDAPFTMSESNGGIPDTIVIENDDPTSVRGSGTIRNGAMRRRIKGQTGKTAVAYQFHSSNTSIEIDTIGNNPEYVTIAKFPTLSADTSRYFAFKGGTVDTQNNFVRLGNITSYSKWVFGQVGHKLGDSTVGPLYEITTEAAGTEKTGTSVPLYSPVTVSLNYDPTNLKGIPENSLGILKTARALKVKTLVDADKSSATSDDRVAKNWNVKIYRTSVSPNNVIATTNDSELLLEELIAGVYIVEQFDSAEWRPLQQLRNGIVISTDSHRVSITISEEKLDSIIFVNYSTPDTLYFRTLKASSGFSQKAVKMKFKKGVLSGSAPNFSTAVEGYFTGLKKAGKKYDVLLGYEQSTKENSAKYGWLTFKGSKDVGKLFTTEHTGQAYPIDSLRVPSKKTKKLAKGIKADKKKYDNIAWEQGVLFNLNLRLSEKGITPPGLGTLTVDTPVVLAMRPLKGKPLTEVAILYDSVMTYYESYGVTNADAYEELENFVKDFLKRVNDGFVEDMSSANYFIDTAKVTVGKDPYAVYLLGVRTAADVKIVRNTGAKIGEREISYSSQFEPERFSLYQNYPNPFNPQTVIGFSLLAVSNVSLKIYNVLGQEVTTLLNNETMEEGEQEVEFDASSLSSGVYFYRLVTSSEHKTFVNVKKMVLMK